MLSNILLLLSIQSFLLTGEAFVTYPKNQALSRIPQNAAFSQNNLQSKTKIFSTKDRNGKGSLQNLINLPIAMAFTWSLLPGSTGATNIAIMDTSIDTEHPFIARHFQHQACIPDDYQRYW